MRFRSGFGAFLAGALALALLAGVAAAATITGDDGDNVLTGTPQADRIDAILSNSPDCLIRMR